jgi:hypothetical protein
MLQVGLGLPDVPASPQSTASNRLFMRSFDPGTHRVLLAELLGLLPLPGRLQRLVMLACLQADDPRLLLRLGASRPEQTSKPSPARACQLGSSATGPMIVTPYSRWLSTRT